MTSFVRTKTLGLLIAIIFAGMNSNAQAPKEKDKEAILGTMARQEACWNKGDLECFMKGYWENDGLKFIGKSGITYGYAATLERYQKSYPDKAAMGKLTFDILHVDAIGKKEIMVVGKWHLKRENDEPQGHFTLIWKKIGGEWVIIADHSS